MTESKRSLKEYHWTRIFALLSTFAFIIIAVYVHFFRPDITAEKRNVLIMIPLSFSLLFNMLEGIITGKLHTWGNKQISAVENMNRFRFQMGALAIFLLVLLWFLLKYAGINIGI